MKGGSDFLFLGLDPNRTEGIDVRASAFVQRTDGVSFTHGIAVGTRLKQDSVALAIAALPTDILKAVALGRSGAAADQSAILQQKIDLTTKLKELAMATKALKEAQAAVPAGPIAGVGGTP